MLGCVQLFVTPWTVAHQAPLSMGFPRQEYWSGLPFPLQGIFLAQGLNPHLLCLLHWQVDFFFFTTEPSGKPRKQQDCYLIFEFYCFKALLHKALKMI